VIRNFASVLFHESAVLQRVIASYLDGHSIDFDDAIIRPIPASGSVQISPEQMENSPLRVFQRLEAVDHEHHNVERLFEHVWQRHGDDGDLWEALAWDGVLTNLIGVCIAQFGFGPAHSMPGLLAGNEVASCLVPGDRIINLNYDTLLELALQQAGRFLVYAPESARGAIVVYKPHGSINLYADRLTGDAFFADPSQMRGSVALRDSDGRVWSTASAIVPPRMAKTYEQHPVAVRILSTVGHFKPEIVTFWGVGMTTSDVDLLHIYKAACSSAIEVEFINPDPDAHRHAQDALGISIQRYERLSDWLDVSRIA